MKVGIYFILIEYMYAISEVQIAPITSRSTGDDKDFMGSYFSVWVANNEFTIWEEDCDGKEKFEALHANLLTALETKAGKAKASGL
jgi:hypothetical protein